MSTQQERIEAEAARRPHHADAIRVNLAAELLTARMSGRRMGGGDVVVEYDPEYDTSYWSDVCTRFIDDHSDWGVEVDRIG